MLSINVSGLKNNVIPQLKTSKEYLGAIQLLIMAIKVPDDFSYGSTIHGMPSKISNIIENLNNIENWIDKHIADFNNAENSNKNLLEKFLNNLGIDFDENDANALKFLLYMLFAGKSSITEEDYQKARSFLKSYLELCQDQENRYGEFGVDQGYFDDELVYGSDKEIEQYAEFFSQKYNMSKATAVKIMQYLNSIGACTYADSTNLIIQKLQNSPDEFEKIFGFPLYTEDEYKNKKFNGDLVLFDMYVWANSEENGGVLFSRNSEGELLINDNAFKSIEDDGNRYLEFSDQQYMNQDNNLNNYLNSKSDDITCEKFRKDFSDINNSNDAKTMITNILNNNIEDVQISLRTYSEDGITFENVETGDEVVADGGHICTIVDYDDEGIYVSTWGEEYFVKYSELYGNEYCRIDITDINIK